MNLDEKKDLRGNIEQTMEQIAGKLADQTSSLSIANERDIAITMDCCALVYSEGPDPEDDLFVPVERTKYLIKSLRTSVAGIEDKDKKSEILWILFDMIDEFDLGIQLKDAIKQEAYVAEGKNPDGGKIEKPRGMDVEPEDEIGETVNVSKFNDPLMSRTIDPDEFADGADEDV